MRERRSIGAAVGYAMEGNARRAAEVAAKRNRPKVALIELGREPAPEQHALYQDTDPRGPYYDPDPT